MRRRELLAIPALFPMARAQQYRVYTEHPRLLLPARRLKLLKRERERESLRWVPFQTLIRGKAAMPEPGFAHALYYAVTGEAASAVKAIEWATGPGSDLRQLALVYDWCFPALPPAQAKALEARLRSAAQSAPGTMGGWRDRVFAATALGEVDQTLAESALREAVEGWWNGQFAPALKSGKRPIPLEALYPMLELLHAIRDTLNVDLRVPAGAFFKDLPHLQVAAIYPAPYPAPENEFRVPAFSGKGEIDLRRAALLRGAGLSTVAYESNAVESQYLQGWLLQDRFLMRGAFGSPYEFLWGNPYQPGLSYEHLPLTYHNPATGRLFVRSNWEEDAVWFGLVDGERQVFRAGHISVLTPDSPAQIGETSIVPAKKQTRFEAGVPTVFVTGNAPRTAYEVEIDDEEMREVESDAAGTIALDFPKERRAGVRIRQSRS